MAMDSQTPNPSSPPQLLVPAPPPESPIKKPPLKAALSAEAAAEKEEAAAAAKKAAAFLQAVSFKEESNLPADLVDAEKTALAELKSLVQAALSNNDFSPPPPPPPTSAVDQTPPASSPAGAPAEETPKAAPLEPTPPPVNAVDSAAPESDEDGAKTVEAIAETIVPIAPDSGAQEAVKQEEKNNPNAAAAPAAEEAAAPPPSKKEEVLIWGVPLLGDERSDAVLLKFLRARDFKAKEAMAMIKGAVQWREQFGVEGLLEEDLGVPELEKVVFMHGIDKHGHPVCYNVYGELQSKELYGLAFADEQKRKRFLRWRIQYLEKGIRNLLDFAPGGVSTMVQVIDLKNSVGPGKKELRQALALLQDNYPEFAAKQIFINVPWWYLAFNRMISPFFTQRTKSKFVFAGPSKSAETLFKYISPEQVPVQYGGLSNEKDPDFTVADAVTEITIKPSTKQVVEIPVDKECLLVWELRVLGWDVNYGAEFVPNSEDGYTVIIQKARKMATTEQPVFKDSFKIGEAGKVVITVNNTSSKKKQLLYRCKTKSCQVKN